MTETTFTDDSGDVRFSGKIRMGGTAGQVATVQANGTLAPAAGGGSLVQQVRAPITSPQILDLFNTPVQIVAAPGAGKTIVPVAVSFTYLAGGTPYTDNGGTIVLYSTVHGGFAQTSKATQRRWRGF